MFAHSRYKRNPNQKPQTRHQMDCRLNLRCTNQLAVWSWLRHHVHVLLIIYDWLLANLSFGRYKVRSLKVRARSTEHAPGILLWSASCLTTIKTRIYHRTRVRRLFQTLVSRELESSSSATDEFFRPRFLCLRARDKYQSHFQKKIDLGALPPVLTTASY